MNIEYSDTPQAPTKQEALAGDLLNIDGYIAILTEDNNLFGFRASDHPYPNSAVHIHRSSEIYTKFENGDYKILARAGDWHIKVDKRAGA